jgi:uncharacterized protein (DUF1499 family)
LVEQSDDDAHFLECTTFVFRFVDDVQTTHPTGSED